MKQFPEPIDLNKVKVYPLAERQSLSAIDQLLVDPGQPPRACEPASQEAIRGCALKLTAARQRDASVILMYGAHLIKNGAMGIVYPDISTAAQAQKAVEICKFAPIGKRSVAAFGVGPGLNYQGTIGEWYGSLDNPKKQEPDTYLLYMMLAVKLGLFGALAWAWLRRATGISAAMRRRSPLRRALNLIAPISACVPAA